MNDPDVLREGECRVRKKDEKKKKKNTENGGIIQIHAYLQVGDC